MACGKEICNFGSQYIDVIRNNMRRHW